jgi:transcriptional regulator PpsR
MLLQEAATIRQSARRQFHHESTSGLEVPVLYAAVNLGRGDRFLVVGRDLRPVANLQQKLIEAQILMERDYALLRQGEARYRLLFQLSSEPTLIVDSISHKVIEANPAAVSLFGDNPKRIVGRVFPEGLDADSAERARALLTDLCAGGRGSDVPARLTSGDRRVTITASLLRQEISSILLIRMPGGADNPTTSPPSSGSHLLRLVESSPDGMVFTDDNARILSSNAAFAEMVQLNSAEQARGKALERWLGRTRTDLHVLVANLRQSEAVHVFSTILRGEYGAVTDVEVSAVPVQEHSARNFGFAVRNVGRRLSATPRSDHRSPRSLDQLTELIGRVPLKNLVRDTVDVIERLCIETALNLTGNNRASAAKLLGVSRQSLYAKLRRFGLAEVSENPEQ